ncbi:conserved hypothetical protein [Parvibaculum lavamentivorans DS-1]|uniref:DUF3047 domain-containing protein n=1 Tax=Parvibaculum lavamentivorans (strain DS-1 / DSM 13023 / NCIMB 13966) TaxID=402881 RepID=A7HS26_PARL1|nr:DUF3047 domain-containing protein [Parvibaculum lavamentivorans]ABS62709.1 conserved hypothetical protein [Parvibaculum lavamentivorans DS-1]
MAEKAGFRTLITLGRLTLRSLGRSFRPRGIGPAAGAPFERGMASLLADPVVAASVREARVLSLTPEGSWLAAGIEVAPGDEVTVLAAGGFWASRVLDLGFGARIGVWLRAGEAGAIAKTPSNASTVRMEEGGPLHIVAKPPGEWLDEQGRFDPAFPRGGVAGAIGVCVIVWKGPALSGLEAMSRAGDYEGLVARALESLRNPVPAPAGWRYLWRLGNGEIFREKKSGDTHSICCHTAGDVGILQFPADFPLTENTRLRWRWKADRLPCDLPEDIQPTHDYLSIAVEFENGQDLTYMWSSSLAEGTIFRCPLPYWDQVETHWVLRSNPAHLGRWLHEEQPLKADYMKAVGVPPQRIVKIWLIAVSVFQRHEGICEYADIELVDGDKVLKIL